MGARHAPPTTHTSNIIIVDKDLGAEGPKNVLLFLPFPLASRGGPREEAHGLLISSYPRIACGRQPIVAMRGLVRPTGGRGGKGGHVTQFYVFRDAQRNNSW